MWFRPSYMEGDRVILGWSPSASETVFTEVTATLTFNDDDIRAVYIDWDDGTTSAGVQSNKKENAVYQWYQTTEPQKEIEVKHTYTASGTFNPVVQTVNSRGFFSRYTSSGAVAADSPRPYTDATVAGTWPKMAMADGISTGIMKIENRTVKSGIDNSIFNVEGPKDLFVQVAPTLSAAELAYLCETGAAATGKVEIDVKCELTYGIRDGDGGAGTQTDTGGEKIVKTLPLVLSGAHITGNGGAVEGIRNVLASGAHNLGALESGAQVSNILEVKYKNPKYMGTNTAAYTENEVFNRFKVFFVASSSALAKYVPVTYVSAGDPIKKASEPISNFTMDFSQSRAKASNISIASYRYDIGKSWFQSANAWETGSATTFSDATSGTSATKVGAYTYMTRPDGLYGATAAYNVFSTAATSKWDTTASDSIQDQIVLDDYGRFYPQYHLTRMSAMPSSSAALVSTITDNKPDVFRITPAISWSINSDTTTATQANARIFPSKVIDSGTNASRSKLYTAEAFNNTSGSSGLVDLAAMNSMTFYDVSNTARANAREYLLLMFDKKTNNVFFNMSPYADNIMSSLGTDPLWGIAGVSYLAVENKDTPLQNAYWRPLEFDDTTAVHKEYRDASNEKYTNMKASLSKSGYLSFDMPLDWQNISLSGACGGVFNKTTIPTATGDFDLGAELAIGSVGTSVDGTVIGDYIPFTMTTNPIPSTVSNSGIGSFKYMFIRVDNETPAVSGAYWITKDGADGYDSATDKIYLHLGDKSSTTGVGITKGYIRRVNVYDVLDGFSKVYMPSGGSATQLFGVGDDASNWGVPWNNSYNIISGSTVGDAIEDAWAGTEKYLLKVVLSGTDATSTNIFPEIWNIFDATRGYGDIVREIDNSAYNLNSLSLVSDVGVSRAGNFYQAITRKGKVFIARVGTPIQTISFGSVAMGDTTSATPFTTWGARNTLYGHLHMVRKIQADGVRVYWDEPQKDGTYVRFWGVVTDVAETHPAGGPRVIISYTFNMVVEEIALIDANFKLMTDVFPLGSVEYDRSYT